MNDLNRFKSLKDIELEENIPVDVLLKSWREYNINLYVHFNNEAGYLKCHYPLDPIIDEKYYSPSNPPQICGIEDIRNFKYSDTTSTKELNNCVVEGYASGFWVILPPNNKNCPSFLLNRYMGLGHHCTEYHQVSQIFAIKNEEDLSEQIDLMNIKSRIDRMNFNLELLNRLKINKYNLFANLNATELLYGLNPNFQKENPITSDITDITDITNVSDVSDVSDIPQNLNLENKKLNRKEITIETIIYLLNKHYLNQEHADYETISSKLSSEFYSFNKGVCEINKDSIKRWYSRTNSQRISKLASTVLYTIIRKHYTRDMNADEIIKIIPEELKHKLNINKNIVIYWINKFNHYNLIQSN